MWLRIPPIRWKRYLLAACGLGIVYGGLRCFIPFSEPFGVVMLIASLWYWMLLLKWISPEWCIEFRGPDDDDPADYWKRT